MRIGFDARMIDHPGIGRYIRNLLTAMLTFGSEDKFVLYGETAKLFDFKNCVIKEYAASAYNLREFFINPFRHDELDLVHVPHFNAPLYNINKLVVTIHDLIYLKFRQSRPSYIPDALARSIIAAVIRRADRIIAVSENTRKDIIEFFPYATGKIDVVYEAVDPIFKKVDDESLKSAIKKKYLLPDNVILFVGSLKKHKNIEGLIDTYKDLKSRGIKLVIVGRYRPREKDLLRKVHSTDALYLGEIPTQDLVAVYNLASLLVLPSLYEGFGLPALEAMACGLPIAASYAASLPEIIKDAGVFFNPYEAKDIADKICQVIKDEGLRKALIDKGADRVRDFSWEKTARETLEVYKKA
jgi:glycosyltransferase involved in cell wall biosynthesis